VFVSGTVGIDACTGRCPETGLAQLEIIFEIIGSALRGAGSSLADVVRCRVFMTDATDLDAVLEALAVQFADVRPANTTIICHLPVPGAKVEIEVTARLRSGPAPSAQQHPPPS
jgi:enamine deaminase RidA (YjgF/YER057c/UK114 family)